MKTSKQFDDLDDLDSPYEALRALAYLGECRLSEQTCADQPDDELIAKLGERFVEAGFMDELQACVAGIVSQVPPKDYDERCAWLNALDMLVHVAYGADLFADHSLGQDLGLLVEQRCVQLGTGNGWWRFGRRAQERLQTAGRDLLPWGAMRPAVSTGELMVTDVDREAVVLSWSMGELHEDDEKWLSKQVAIAGVWQDTYRSFLRQFLDQRAWDIVVMDSALVTEAVLVCALPHLGRDAALEIWGSGPTARFEWPESKTRSIELPVSEPLIVEVEGDKVTGPLKVSLRRVDPGVSEQAQLACAALARAVDNPVNPLKEVRGMAVAVRKILAEGSQWIEAIKEVDRIYPTQEPNEDNLYAVELAFIARMQLFELSLRYLDKDLDAEIGELDQNLAPYQNATLALSKL